MKKTVHVILAALLMMVFLTGAVAETVYVSISSGEGKIVLAHAAVDASDVDGDGAVTIDDALSCAHEAFYEGGAAAGYASEVSDYGKSMLRLWGEENGGSYGYYLNNASPMSLLDPVSDGDSVFAYAYQDLVSWSDTYCFFQTESADISAGESTILTLTALIYDADWNLVPAFVDGAVITINGVDSEWKTNADGSCSLSFSEPGEYLISARSESTTLVPPVCVVSVR